MNSLRSPLSPDSRSSFITLNPGTSCFLNILPTPLSLSGPWPQCDWFNHSQCKGHGIVSIVEGRDIMLIDPARPRTCPELRERSLSLHSSLPSTFSSSGRTYPILGLGESPTNVISCLMRWMDGTG